jgi:hypothetical protein
MISGLHTRSRIFLCVIFDLLDICKLLHFIYFSHWKQQSKHQHCILAVHGITESVWGDCCCHLQPNIKTCLHLKSLLILLHQFKPPIHSKPYYQHGASLQYLIWKLSQLKSYCLFIVQTLILNCLHELSKFKQVIKHFVYWLYNNIITAGLFSQDLYKVMEHGQMGKILASPICCQEIFTLLIIEKPRHQAQEITDTTSLNCVHLKH